MLALIKREIEESIAFFLIAAIAVTILVCNLVYKGYMGWMDGQHVQNYGVPSVMYEVLPSFILLPLVAAALGAAQMSTDKNRKVSSFLVTLATTRRRILAAKIIVGVLWLMLAILPVGLADIVLLKVFPMIAVPDAGFLMRIFAVIFSCGMACYCFGLQIGWQSSKVIPALGVIFVSAAMMSLIMVKGISGQTIVIYLLFAAAAMIRTWQKYLSTSL